MRLRKQKKRKIWPETRPFSGGGAVIKREDDR